MNQQIVPALPTERAQYERWYQLGLATMTATNVQLRAYQAAQHDKLMPWFPRFMVRCSAVGADQHVDAVIKAANGLTVMPNAITIDADYVDLTFALTTNDDVWHPTEGAAWRLYDGLLNNLIGTVFQPVTAITVGLSANYPASTGTARVIRPNFSMYGAPRAERVRVTVVPTTVTSAGPHGQRPTNRANVYALKNARP